MMFSLLCSVLLVVCYFFTIQLLKKNKEAMLKNKFLHTSLLFWIFFTLLGFVSYNLMSHFINIEYNCKNAVIKESSEKLQVVDSAFFQYQKRSKEDIANFDAQLRSKLNDFKNGRIPSKPLTDSPYNIEPNVLSGNKSYLNVNAIAAAIINPKQLKIEQNIKNIDSTISINNKKYQSVFDNWKRLSLMGTFIKLNQYVDDNINNINKNIEELPLNKTPLTFRFNQNQLPLSNPKELNKLYPPDYKIALIVILLTHIFILIPFFSHKVRGYVNSSNKKNKIDSQSENISKGGSIEI